METRKCIEEYSAIIFPRTVLLLLRGGSSNPILGEEDLLR
jgi:hypothetical protein